MATRSRSSAAAKKTTPRSRKPTKPTLTETGRLQLVKATKAVKRTVRDAQRSGSLKRVAAVAAAVVGTAVAARAVFKKR